MVCMIGGVGSLFSKMARTKSMPGIAAMTSVGVTPYSIFGAVVSCIEKYPVSNDEYHIKQLVGTPVLWARCFSVVASASEAIHRLRKEKNGLLRRFLCLTCRSSVMR